MIKYALKISKAQIYYRIGKDVTKRLMFTQYFNIFYNLIHILFISPKGLHQCTVHTTYKCQLLTYNKLT